MDKFTLDEKLFITNFKHKILAMIIVKCIKKMTWGFKIERKPNLTILMKLIFIYMHRKYKLWTSPLNAFVKSIA